MLHKFSILNYDKDLRDYRRLFKRKKSTVQRYHPYEDKRPKDEIERHQQVEHCRSMIFMVQ